MIETTARGVPKRTEHGHGPIFSTVFGKIVCIFTSFTNFGNWNTGGHGDFFILTDI